MACQNGEKMREILWDNIVSAVSNACIEANCQLNADVYDALKNGANRETNEHSQAVLNQLIENAEIAKTNHVPICQDTGMVVAFVQLGKDAHISGGLLNDAINEGVRRGYKEGYLRKSIVKDPLLRINTGDNTPAVIHLELVEGTNIQIDISPKGFGSENMGKLAMLKPSDGVNKVKEFVVTTVSDAGANPCPPIIVGVGIGGTMEKAAILAKHSLLRPVGELNKNTDLVILESELLDEINRLGIGPGGLGGRTTALAVHIESFPTHIAGLPVAVNISCHVTRHVSIIL